MGKMLHRYVSDAYRDHPLSTLNDRLRELAPRGTPAQLTQIALLPMLLPALVAKLEQIIVLSDEDPAARGLAGGLLSYVYNPLDIIPDDEGPLGLLDDVVICAIGLTALASGERWKLDEITSGACECVVALVPSLAPDLAQALKDFVAQLIDATSRQVQLGVFARSANT